MMNYSWSLTIRVIVISLFIGGASGVLATALTSNYLWQYAFELSEPPNPAPHHRAAARFRRTTRMRSTLDRVLKALAVFSYQRSFAGFAKICAWSVVALTSDGWLSARFASCSYR